MFICGIILFFQQKKELFVFFPVNKEGYKVKQLVLVREAGCAWKKTLVLVFDYRYVFYILSLIQFFNFLKEVINLSCFRTHWGVNTNRF